MKTPQNRVDLARQHAIRIERASMGKDLRKVNVEVVCTRQLGYYADKVRAALIRSGCRSVRVELGGPWDLSPMGIYVCVQDRSNTPTSAYVLLEMLSEAGILDSDKLERFPSGKPGIVYVLIGKVG